MPGTRRTAAKTAGSKNSRKKADQKLKTTKIKEKQDGKCKQKASTSVATDNNEHTRLTNPQRRTKQSHDEEDQPLQRKDKKKRTKQNAKREELQSELPQGVGTGEERSVDFDIENLNSVNFIDRDRIMTMTVQTDKGLQSEESEEMDYVDEQCQESDQEISFRQEVERSEDESSVASQSSDEEEEGRAFSKESDTQEEPEVPQVVLPAREIKRPKVSGRNKIDESQARQQQIKEIDLEVQGKIAELQTLVQQGGLTRSAHELQKLQMATKPTRGKNKNTNSNRKSEPAEPVFKTKRSRAKYKSKFLVWVTKQLLFRRFVDQFQMMRFIWMQFPRKIG